MSECDNRKQALTELYWKLYNKIDNWQKTNPVEKMDWFHDIVFHKSCDLKMYQTYISFTINKNSNYVKDYYKDKEVDEYNSCENFSFTLDPQMAAPVMLIFHTIQRTCSYYLSSDRIIFRPVLNKKDRYWHREFADAPVIKILKELMNLTYNRYENTFVIENL